MTQILILPGLYNSGDGHWQTLWERRLQNIRRVEQKNWDAPELTDWLDALENALDAVTGDAVLVGHSLGVATIVHLAHARGRHPRGALLVAPSDLERSGAPEAIRGFAPVPLAPLPFPSIVVTSENDPHVPIDRAVSFATAWGSRFVNIGAHGHISQVDGFGEWPDGLTLLGELVALEFKA